MPVIQKQMRDIHTHVNVDLRLPVAFSINMPPIALMARRRCTILSFVRTMEVEGRLGYETFNEEKIN